MHEGALNSLRVLYTEVVPWREILAPDAAWDRAFTKPNYGRDPAYWTETATTACQGHDEQNRSNRLVVDSSAD